MKSLVSCVCVIGNAGHVQCAVGRERERERERVRCTHQFWLFLQFIALLPDGATTGKEVAVGGDGGSGWCTVSRTRKQNVHR